MPLQAVTISRIAVTYKIFLLLEIFLSSYRCMSKTLGSAIQSFKDEGFCHNKKRKKKRATKRWLSW